MRGRIWLIVGAVVGVAVAAGHLPYLAGAGRSLADTAEHLVGHGANRLVHDTASAGAPKRLVLGLAGLLAALLPGLTALLLVVAARAGLRLRAIISLLVVAVAGASYLYQSNGKATGVLLLALTVAAAALLLTGPFVAAPLCALAGLIAGTFLPTLLRTRHVATQVSVDDIHQALYGHPGTPNALKVAVLVLAAVPFVFAARLVIWR